MDKIKVKIIFEKIGITVDLEEINVERLSPKRETTTPHPLMARLCSHNEILKSTVILKTAK